jgi:hypothetical protein
MLNNDEILTIEKKRKYAKAFISAFNIFNNMEETKNIEFILNKELIIKIFEDYEKIVKCVKKEMLQLHDNENIDSHKISSIFLIAILKHKNIVTATITEKEKKQGILTTFHKLPHIYFAFILGTVIMEGIYNISSKIKVTFNINMNYGKEFVKLIYANQQAIISPAHRQVCDATAKGVFCLSHLFYFIEKVADKQEDNE